MDSSRPRIVAVRLTSEDASVQADVHLHALDRDSLGTANAARSPVGPFRAAAQATLAALQQLLDDRARLELERVEHTGQGDDERVIVTVSVVAAAGVELLIGAARVGHDRTSAAVRATLDALNRRFTLLVQDQAAAAGGNAGDAAAGDAGGATVPGERIAGIASHQIRSPLANLLIGMQTAVDRWEHVGEDARRDLVERAVSQGQRMMRRLDNLLALTTTTDGTPTAVAAPVAIAEVAREAAAEVFGADDPIAIHAPEDVEALADPDHVHQILVNWLDNAQRHGEPPVAVEADLVRGAVEVTVIDHGAGIPPDKVDKLFAGPNGGSRGTSTRSHGLGLYITRLLAEANDGSVRVDTAPGTGTRMTLRLPRA